MCTWLVLCTCSHLLCRCGGRGAQVGRCGGRGAHLGLPAGTQHRQTIHNSRRQYIAVLPFNHYCLYNISCLGYVTDFYTTCVTLPENETCHIFIIISIRFQYQRPTLHSSVGVSGHSTLRQPRVSPWWRINFLRSQRCGARCGGDTEKEVPSCARAAEGLTSPPRSYTVCPTVSGYSIRINSFLCKDIILWPYGKSATKRALLNIGLPQ